MPFRIIIKPSARKDLQKLPVEHRRKIYKAVITIAKDPFMAKQLHGRYQDCFSTRVWPYRVTYRLHRAHSLIILIHI